MSNNTTYKINLDTLFTHLNLGQILTLPQAVKGGLLHKSFEVVSESGHYFVKALNPQIMLRPTAMGNYLFSDKVSRIAADSGVPSSSVLEIQGKTIHLVDGQYYQIFNWVEGVPYVHSPKNLDVCHEIGSLLGKIHGLDCTSIDGQNMESQEKRRVDWNGILKASQQDEVVIKLKENIDFDYLIQIEDTAAQALRHLSDLIISHRDLDPKNVMWGQEGLIVIDWEASGYVNAMHELIEVALYWSKFEDGTISAESFMAVLKGYESVTPLNDEETIFALDAVNDNKIGWIEYNLKRAVGIASNSLEECQLGYQQVVSTVQSIQRYEKQKEAFKQLLENRLGSI